MKWFLKAFRQYADFSGRARRKEYWYFILFSNLFGIPFYLLDLLLFRDWETGATMSLFSMIYGLFMLLPSLSVTVRRLHDVGKSGWMYFICLIPLIGPIWLLILLVQDSEYRANRWGENPKLNEFVHV